MFEGLGALVDILTGVMAGANYSTKIRHWTHNASDAIADLGQVFIAVDPNCFAPNFEDRMVDFNSRLRGCEPVSSLSLHTKMVKLFHFLFLLLTD